MIELCSALSVGGLTPSVGLVKKCTRSKKVEIHTMIRHREGHFNYSRGEVRLMKKDILSMKKAGASGIVFGCLDKKGMVDKNACSLLLETGKELEMEVSFHRAIDFCPDLLGAIQMLIELGFDRILSSGQKETAIEGIENIRKMTEVAQGEIQIMAGSGVNAVNAMKLVETGIDALHFTSHLPGPVDRLGMGQNRKMDKIKIKKIIEELNKSAVL
jgi:copper homeostasis protein